MFHKIGETIDNINIESSDAAIPLIDSVILENFKKTASNLKKIAPHAEDFLYFSAVMMHAAEASAINDDGTPKLNSKGEPVQVGWDKKGGTWRWMSNDPSIKPLKNSNGDIFPAEELIKAHKKWVGKPLCIDHKSSSVDHTRGFIVDTYYDRNLKRVVALCALDKANYPDLARKVSTGMQTSVSMGTAVGKAICTDCAAVARVEADFCDHMRRKSGYGEINVDLNPIELSIVVNGADPKAHIKHIIAAANTLNSYVELKSKELNKLADLDFKATFTVKDPKGAEIGSEGTFNFSSNNLDDFKKDIEKSFEKLQEIVEETKKSEKDTNDLAFNQSSGSIAMDDTAVPDNTELAPPVARYASDNAIGELKEVISAIQNKLNLMNQSLQKLAQNTHEENMSSKEMNKHGYYQGGGGVNEPTPGQAKYPKDPLQEHVREYEDKQMVGQSPFPEVGDVDGLHPSPSSADPSNELERKKMLARAEVEERAIRRQAIANLAKKALEDKKGYFNNGENPNNVNSPTPGKVKYLKDPLQEEDREFEDKHMVGQKPFPGVGSVDGLHPSPDSAEPSDELKRKQMLRRANTLHGKFVRASNLDGTSDLDNSAWEIRLGDKLLLTASVKELSGDHSEIMYDTINTAEFGQKLLEKVKVLGADKVRALFKTAQQDASSAPQAPPAPAAPMAPGAPDVPDAPVDSGESGDKKDSALKLSEKIRDLSSDLVEAVRALTGEQAEMGDAPAADMGATASDYSLEKANALKYELNQSLTSAMKEVLANLQSHEQELDMIVGVYDKGNVNASNQDFVNSIVDDAVNEAKTAVADGFRLMNAFVKYARGSKAIVKRAEIEAELEALANGDTMDTSSDNDLMSLIEDTNSNLNSVKELMDEDHDHDHLGSLEDEDSFESLDEDHDLGEEDDLGDKDLDLDEELSADDSNDLMAKPEELKDLEVKPGTNVQVTAGYDSKQSRASLRAKLAADALGKYDDGDVQDMSKAKFSDMLDAADKLSDGQTQLDVKPSDNLGLVETLPEVNKAMLEVAKMPPKVRKQAEAIQRLIVEGQLDPKDVDNLVAEGLDKDAVTYWKKFYGQVDGGNEFASELVKEHVKAQLEKELNTFKVKMARAYELTYDMVDRSLVANERNVISAHVDELMNFSEANFETLKKVVAKHPVTLRKEASNRVPQVGMIGSGDFSPAPTREDDWSLLSAAFSKTSNRMF